MKTNRSVSKIKITDLFPRDALAAPLLLEAAHSWWLSRASWALPKAMPAEPEPVARIKLTCNDWDLYVFGYDRTQNEFIGRLRHKTTGTRHTYLFGCQGFVDWCREHGFDVRRDGTWEPKPIGQCGQ
ncbi:MAG: hypothetical protein NTY19_43895 [Planctomycetota bacterium]|nr:hypothetical protein [Planctomycetota bacterium]